MPLSELEYVINCTFHYVEGYESYYYDVNNVKRKTSIRSFYWRSCVLRENEDQGTQGYMMVWLNDDGTLNNQFHTYKYPPDIHPRWED